MLVEFIIDKDEYKQLIKNNDFKASNGIDVAKRSLKANGKDNYYFRISVNNSNLEAAQALSEIKYSIESEFKKNSIYYRVLTDESSQYFTNVLYRYIMEFETKLRKFIHNTLFDVSDASMKRILVQLKANLKNVDKNTIVIPKIDFLEYATLEDVYKFLFSNNGLYGDVRDYVASKDNLCHSRKELLEYISQNKLQTTWEDFFESDFSDSSLPKDFLKIIDCRNDVMHFHYISYSQYNEYLALIDLAIKDLDKQIKKGIVIESTVANIDKLSGNSNYIQTLFNGFQSFATLQGAIRTLMPDYLSTMKTFLDGFSSLANSFIIPNLQPDYITRMISPSIVNTLNPSVISLASSLTLPADITSSFIGIRGETDESKSTKNKKEN